MIDSLPNERDIEEHDGESSSLIVKTKQKALSSLESVQGEAIKAIEEKTGDLSQPNYLWMAIFFALGCFFLMAAMTALPFFIISPSGFNTYFSLASSCLMISVSFFYGPWNYLKKLYARENIIISVLYSASTVASLLSMFTHTGYLYSIALAVTQVVALAFFILQVVSGGENANGRLQSMMTAGKDAVQTQVMKGVVNGIMNSDNKGGDIKLPI